MIMKILPRQSHTASFPQNETRLAQPNSGPAQSSPGPTPTFSATAAKTSTNNGNPHKTCISGGAVAGAAVGGLVVGAFIAAILLFLLLQKRQNQIMSHRQSGFSQKQHKRPEKMSVVHTNAISTVDEYLPQVVDDDAVKTEVSRISDNIKNHVRTHYHSNGVVLEQMDISRLESLEMATGVPCSTIVAALVDTSTRTYALRLFIAWTILTKVGPESPSNLLPQVLSPLASTLAVDTGKNTASATLFSKWKVITGVLLQQNQGKQGVSQQTSAEALTDLDRVLGPFVSVSSDGVQRKRNLEMILSKAGSLSLLLFSQPGSYRFDFAIPKGSLTVFPALLQTIDSDSKRLDPPKLIWKKETMGAAKA